MSLPGTGRLYEKLKEAEAERDALKGVLEMLKRLGCDEEIIDRALAQKKNPIGLEGTKRVTRWAFCVGDSGAEAYEDKDGAHVEYADYEKLLAKVAWLKGRQVTNYCEACLAESKSNPQSTQFKHTCEKAKLAKQRRKPWSRKS